MSPARASPCLGPLPGRGRAGRDVGAVDLLRRRPGSGRGSELAGVAVVDAAVQPEAASGHAPRPAAPPRSSASRRVLGRRPFASLTLRQDTGVSRRVRLARARGRFTSRRLIAWQVTDPADEISELSSTLDQHRGRARPGAMRNEAEPTCASRPPTRGCGTTRTGRRRSPAGCPTWRASWPGSRACASGSTTPRCCSSWPRARTTSRPATRPTRELAALRSEIDELEVRTLLSGEYDAREALITINAQAGGADAADFAEILLRMYLRWAERHELPDRGLRHLLRGGGRHQVDHLRGQGPLRLRHAARRARHAPDGPHLPVRQPGPPADLVRRAST